MASRRSPPAPTQPMGPNRPGGEYLHHRALIPESAHVLVAKRHPLIEPFVDLNDCPGCRRHRLGVGVERLWTATQTACPHDGRVRTDTDREPLGPRLRLHFSTGVGDLIGNPPLLGDDHRAELMTDRRVEHRRSGHEDDPQREQAELQHVPDRLLERQSGRAVRAVAPVSDRLRQSPTTGGRCRPTCRRRASRAGRRLPAQLHTRRPAGGRATETPTAARANGRVSRRFAPTRSRPPRCHRSSSPEETETGRAGSAQRP